MEIQNVFKWLARFETGGSPTAVGMLQQAGQVIKQRWKTRVKTATQAAIQMQATEDDFENLAKFQQYAFGSVGLNVGAPPIK